MMVLGNLIAKLPPPKKRCQTRHLYPKFKYEYQINIKNEYFNYGWKVQLVKAFLA